MTEQKTFTARVKEELLSIKEKRCCKAAKKNAETFLEQNTLIDRAVFKCDECRNAFLRAVFLGCGSISDPKKSNHLELKFSNEMNADEVCILIRETGIDPKVSKRRGNYIVYFKDGNVIFDFLMLIGAQLCAYEQVNEKIVKDIRNNVNRRSNCEMANMIKTASATAKQLEAIKLLEADEKMENLPDKLLYTASLRRDNPDLSLTDLAAIHEPPITKSCVNHRLEKIIRIAFGE